VSLDFASILNAVVTHAKSLGVFETVTTHEPKSAPGVGVSASIWVTAIDSVKSSGLGVTSLRLELGVRIYKQMTSQPEDEIDMSLVNALSALWDAYSGDFQLGGQVRGVDLLGSDGAAMSARAGYVQMDNAMFRTITIALPLIINDVHTQTP
jgi:hypothetical protein